MEAWDKERVYADVAGVATTDKDGAFRIELDERSIRSMFKDRRPDLYFKLLRGKKLIKSTEKEIARKIVIGETRVLIQVDVDAASILALPEEEAPPAPEPKVVEPPKPVEPVIVEKVVERLVMQSAPAVVEKKKPRVPAGGVEAAAGQPPSNQQLHVISGQVIDATSGAPIAGVVVRAYDLDEGPEARDLGADRSGGRGQFTVGLALPRGQAPTGRRLRAVVTHDGREIQRHDWTVTQGADSVEIRATVPVAEAPVSPRLEELQFSAQLYLPPAVLSFLGRRGIYTLHDVRAAGGVAHLQGLPVQSDAEPVRHLEAHASLELLTSDARTSGYLIQQGYGSIRAIAETSSAQFVRSTRDTLGELGAAQLHARARAQTDFLNDVLAWVSSGGAHPLSAIQALPPSPEPRAEDSALSPAAYLADLLDLARRHLTDGGKPVGLTAIAAKLHQPLAELPAGGAQATRPVRQVRIAVEALRSRQGGAVDGEEAYREAAYHALLDQIGTSYDELRRSRSAPVDRRRALADRLGFDSVERLDKLLVDLDRPRALTEKLLEELFGLVDTTRPSLSEAPPEAEILKWRLGRLEARWRDQDRPNSAYHDGADARRPIIDPDVLTLADLRQPQPGQSPYILFTARRNWVDAARDKLVALRNFAGAVDDVLGKIDLVQLSAGLAAGEAAALREITRQHDLTVDAFRRLAELSAKSEQLSDEEWLEACVILTQVKKVRQFAAWLSEEQGTIVLGPAQFVPLQRPARELQRWLAGAQAREAYEEALRRRSEPPVIDPDLLGPGDFRHPAAGNTAWDLYSVRRERLDKQLQAWRTQIGNQTSKLDGLLGGALGLGGGEIGELAQRWRQGEDLSARVEQLGLSHDGFARLCALRDHLQSAATPLDSEWDELYAVLLSSWKRRLFAEWRDEEETQNLMLGPGQFRVDENPAVALEPGRGSYAARRRWQETLEGRVAEGAAVRASLEAAVDACEEATLPLLRDAFIDASSDAGDRQEKAARLSASLHLDLGRAGGEKTTRVGQAAESLQSLLEDARSPDAASDGRIDSGDATFDEEWRWLSSYDAWRAARFAFLHPENLLSPELRRRDRQSPAFRALVAQMGEHITAEAASRAADQFADYFRDVCSLTVEASSVAPARPHKLELRHRTQAVSDVPILYLFARAKTDAVYFSACNQNDPTGYGQGFWQPVPGLPRAGKILGAVPYFPSEEQHFLLLFAQVSASQGGSQGGGAPRLVVTAYDLHEERWSGEVTELDLPARGVFSAVVEQRDQWARPPRVVISMRGAAGARAAEVDLEGYGLLYTRRLNRAGNGWQSRDFRLLLADETTDAVFALLPDNVVVYGSTGNLRVGVFGEEAELERVSTLGAGLWLGALSAPQGETFAFVRRDSGAVVSGPIPVDKIGSGPISLDHAEAPGLMHLAVHSGRDAAEDGREVAYQTRSGAWRGRFVVREGRLSMTSGALVTPRIDGPFDVPSQLAETDLALRAQQLRAAFAETRGLSNLVYLEEAYYFVPTLLALRLQESGQYGAALEWYRTVYDSASSRTIYPGFQQDAQSGFRRASDWLLDPLNPHAVAETRGGAQLRFTLMSLSRCLCDWADAEFARGGHEALARARQLYGRAQSLLADKQLEFELDRGERAVAELDALVTPAWRSSWAESRANLLSIRDAAARREAADEVRQALRGSDGWDARIERALSLSRRARDAQPGVPTYHDVVGRRAAETAQVDHALLGQPEVAEALRLLGDAAAVDFIHGVAAVSGATVADLQGGKISLSWLAGSTPLSTMEAPTPPRRRGEPAPAPAPTPRETRREGGPNPLAALNGLRKLTPKYVPALSPRFAPEPNPLLASLKLRAELQLDQLRGGRTMSGDRRLPSSQSYHALWRRAAELARLGREIEVALAAADERRAAGEYSLLLARQHLGLLDAAAALKARHARAAESEVVASLRHGSSARLQSESLGRLLDEGTRSLERASLRLASQAAPAGVEARLPGYDERAAEWEDDRAVAIKEWRLAASEADAARATALLGARAERVASLHAAQAAIGAELLGGRFGDRELHSWVASALERSRRTCLEQAAAVAQLAQAVVGFEQNGDPPAIVRAEYLHAADLLDDLQRLGRRRASDSSALSLEKTLSLAQLAPEALLHFHRTGVLSLRTPLGLFDHDAPGHYQRRVRRASVSLVTRSPAPPLFATLTVSRGSRVVVKESGAFRTVTLLGGPDEVVLSSPGGGPGEISLMQAGGLGGVSAFDGIGVDTVWQLSLSRAAHSFDHANIVDVRLTIGYSALVSDAYRQQVTQSLAAARRASRPFSLRAQFAESWYDLHNPELAATPMSVTFRTRREDFPPNLEALTIEDVALRVVPTNGESIEIAGVELRYAPHGSPAGGGGGVGGRGHSVDGVISSRHASGGGWGALRGLPPVGEWQLTLPDEARARFRGDQIADLLFVVSYAGNPPRR